MMLEQLMIPGMQLVQLGILGLLLQLMEMLLVQLILMGIPFMNDRV